MSTDPSSLDESAFILCRQAIERCQLCVAHLHVIMHTCGPAFRGQAEMAENMRFLLASMDYELQRSAGILEEAAA